MPLYMDRHDLPGATPEQVAQAHGQDLEAAAKHDVQLLPYWLDTDREMAFCFARAAEPGDLAAVHREAHGLMPNEIISVSEDKVLRFLGKINDPGDHLDGTSAFRTILFTDLEGPTSLLQEVGEAKFMLLLTEHDLIIRQALVATQGREVKHTGDGIMASLNDVGHALDCSVAIQDGFDARSAGARRPTCACGSEWQAARPSNAMTTTEQGFAFDQPEDKVLKGFTDPTRVFELLRTRH